MPVIEPTDVKDEFAFDAEALGLSETGFNALVKRLIGRETQRVEDAVDASLGVETVTETVSRPASVDKWDLPLSSRPVQSVASVTIDTDRVGGPGVAASDYEVHETHLELLPGADRTAWPTERRAVEVEYTHGYPEGETPEPIHGALVGLVRHALQEVESDGVSSESIDGHSVTYEPDEMVVSRHLSRAKRFDEPDYYGGAQIV